MRQPNLGCGMTRPGDGVRDDALELHERGMGVALLE